MNKNFKERKLYILNLYTYYTCNTDTRIVQLFFFFFHSQLWVINSRSAITSTGFSNDGKVFLNLFFLGVDIAMICMVIYFLASQEHVGSISVDNFE